MLSPQVDGGTRCIGLAKELFKLACFFLIGLIGNALHNTPVGKPPEVANIGGVLANQTLCDVIGDCDGFLQYDLKLSIVVPTGCLIMAQIFPRSVDVLLFDQYGVVVMVR